MVAMVFRGISFWLAYAVLEFGCSTFLPLLQTPDTIISPWFWKITGFLIVTYGVIGAVMGWGISLFPAGFRANAICALTVAAAAVTDRAMEPRQWVTNPSLLILLPVAATLAWQLINVEWAERLSPLRNHWVVALLVLLPSWMGKELSPEAARPLRIAAAILTLASVALVAILLRRWIGVRSSFLQPLIAVAVLALLAGSAGIVTHRRRSLAVKASASPSGLPNVVLIVLDTVRQDHLPVYGYARKTTPNLERFAAESAVFQQAIATSDVTLSSHASLFTGLYASSHGAHYVLNGPPMGHGLRQDSTTLAEILSKSGYTTAAVVANFGYLGDGFGLMQGFQNVNCLVPLRMTDGLRNFYVQRGMGREIGMRERVGRIASRIWPNREWFQDARRAEEINQDAFGILDESARRKSPLFLFLNYFDTHVPYVPPAPFDRAFPGFDATFSYSGFGRMQEEVISLRRITPAEQAHLVSQYDGALAYLDSQIGQLFDRLKALGIYDNSLIVITSDHGEAFGERSLLEHAGISVYQDQVLVPLLIKYPGKNRPARITETVSQVDVMPTVLATVGLSVPEQIAGRSLVNHPLDGQRLIISESFPNNFKAQLHVRFRRTERAMFLGSLKLIRSTAGKRELYNLSDDPGESRNLYGREEGQRLEEQLQAWLQSTQSGRPAVPAPKPDPRVMERLRSLGYVQ